MITFVGDSNTTAPGGYVPLVQQYGTLIGQALGIPVLVAGVSGEKAAGTFARLPSLLAPGTSHVVIQIGTNDLAASVVDGVPLSTILPAYLATMGQIIDLIRTVAIPIIISPPATKRDQDGLRLPALVEALGDRCVDRRCAFFDLYRLMKRDACTMSAADWQQWFMPDPDPVHLGPVGHAREAAAFLAQMTPILTSSPPPHPDPEPGDIHVVYDQPLTSGMGNIDGKTLKFSITPSTPAVACTRYRLTLKAHASEPLVLSGLGVAGQAVGAVSVPAGAELPLPWRTITWTQGSPVEIAAYCNAGPSADGVPSMATTAADAYHLKSGNCVLPPGTASGWSSYTGYRWLVRRIEMAP